jgi:hypothetical protein
VFKANLNELAHQILRKIHLVAHHDTEDRSVCLYEETGWNAFIVWWRDSRSKHGTWFSVNQQAFLHDWKSARQYGAKGSPRVACYCGLTGFNVVLSWRCSRTVVFKKKAVDSAETLVTTYRTTRRNNPEHAVSSSSLCNCTALYLGNSIWESNVM